MANELVKPDRGTVKRMTFDLLYPNGQLKTIVVENNSEMSLGAFSVVLFDEDAIERFPHPEHSSILKAWREAKKGDPWPPAFVVVNSKNEWVAMCGGHKQLIGV